MDGLLLFKALAPSSGGGFRLVHIKRARGKLRARPLFLSDPQNFVLISFPLFLLCLF
jgi:hypothetical protein